MKKHFFESKEDFIKWLFTGKILISNVRENRRDALALYLGVTFLTKIEAGLSDKDEDDGVYAGEQHYTLSTWGERLPKRFPALLLLNAWKDSYHDLQFDHVWIYESDFKPKKEKSRISLKMVLVEGGSFEMGSEEGFEDEMPIHEVTLSSFHIGQFTVTQKEWEAVMNSNPSEKKGDDLPVTNVSWNDVQEFLTKLNAQTGKQYRLPTEAEWEYAARGGNQSKGFEYAGSGNVDEVAWYYNNSSVGPRPVGQKKPNELGLYDMSGNVYEWCEDWYGEYSSSVQTNPIGPNTGFYRVVRGGSGFFVPQYCRVADRSGYSPGDRSSFLGFRLAYDFKD